MDETLETKIGRMCFVGFEGLEPPEYLLEWIRAGRVGGVILFSRNIASPAQVAALTDALQDASSEGLIISIDQEGGRVARLRAAQGFTEVPGAGVLSKTVDAAHQVEQIAGVLAAEMHAVGINWDYAPVVDLNYNPDNPSVGTRSFGTDGEQIGRLASVFVRTVQAHGVAACAKHFPGLGDTSIDTHQALPVLHTPLEHLRTVDLAPYRDVIAAGVASIMVTHTVYAALDADLPSTLSPVVVNQLLRGELGYDGLVSTDCMEMKAVSDNYGAAESAVLAALAGIDAILFSHTPAWQEQVYDALLDAARSGRLSEYLIDGANRRLLAFRAQYIQPRGEVSIVRSAEHLAIVDAAVKASEAVNS